MLNANQVCIVTGAGKGIGRGIAKVLAGEGATVIADSRNEANLRATVEMITDAGGRACALPLDITDRPGVRKFVDQVIADHGVLSASMQNVRADRNRRAWTAYGEGVSATDAPRGTWRRPRRHHARAVY